jgi:hypothetical protein
MGKATLSGPIGAGDSVSASVRRIDNGYITRRSRYSEGGAYEESEIYSADKPVLEVEKSIANANPGAEAMAKAKAALDRSK